MDQRKTALISGGTSGIGLACASVLMERGWNVVINGRDAARCKAALASLHADGTAAFVAGDVSAEAACEKIVNEAVQVFGRLDGLVTSAGIYGENLIDDVSAEEVYRLFSINVYGTMFLCKYALPYLRKSKGAIVTIGSDAGLQGNIACSAYCATKGAVVSFTRALALEEAPHDVRANCICPGDVATPLLEQQMKDNPALSEDTIKEQYPLYRIARASEIAKVVAFLLSDDASYVTAASWPVDGGLTSW